MISSGATLRSTKTRTLVAVAPAFITHYRLDTTVSGVGKRFTERLERRWPGVLTLGLYAIGSPVAERCDAGSSRHVPESRRPLLLKHVLGRRTPRRR